MSEQVSASLGVWGQEVPSSLFLALPGCQRPPEAQHALKLGPPFSPTSSNEGFQDFLGLLGYVQRVSDSKPCPHSIPEASLEPRGPLSPPSELLGRRTRRPDALLDGGAGSVVLPCPEPGRPREPL